METGVAVAVALAAIRLAEVAVRALAKRNGGGSDLGSKLDRLIAIGDHEIDLLRDLAKEQAVNRMEQRAVGIELAHTQRKVDAVHNRLNALVPGRVHSGESSVE